MKTLFIFVSLFSTSSFANPFDSFIGKFQIDGKIQIKNLNAKACIRYSIPNLTGIEVKQDKNGYKQSHMIYLNNPNGWSGIPVMQFEDRPDYLDQSVVYASKVQGDLNFAEVIHNSNAKEYLSDDFSLERQNGKIILRFSEEAIKNNTVIAGCYYQVTVK